MRRVPTLSSRLLKRTRREASTGCLIWMGAKLPRGYGKMAYQGRPLLAHRVVWEDANGPIPAGMCVCHRCDTPSCVELGHLFLGTKRVNTQDMIRKRRSKCVGLRGEQNPAAKMTPSLVRRLRSDPRPATAIQCEYPVSIDVLWKIRRREAWTHVP